MRLPPQLITADGTTDEIISTIGLLAGIGCLGGAFILAETAKNDAGSARKCGAAEPDSQRERNF